MKHEIGVSPRGAPSSVAERIAGMRESIAAELRSLGRASDSVTLVAVTKKQPLEAVLAAVAAGVRDVGENYVQEAREKYATLPPTVRKHFFGHLQRNKARAIVETFDVVESVDRFDAGLAIARAQANVGRRVRALVQINISPSERFGAVPEEAPELARRLRDEGLDIDGVMAIGPNTEDRGAVARAFALAAQVFERVGGQTLSLGMSNDWPMALAAGATSLRLGTALFGERG